MKTITKEQYQEISARNVAHNTWVDSIREGKNGWASYRPEDKPANVPDVTNEERSSMEVYDFVNTPPEKYFLYVDEKRMIVTTWTGDTLGDITYLSRPFVSGFGRSTRQSLRVKAINGLHYSGFYYSSSGNYARIKCLK